ncbi:MAG TPA: response regulator [Polyangiaceae bacterium]|nr:response regulator [Polyangiaceae bacterium]
MQPRRRGKVLVVDDDPIILEVVRERLHGAGFDVYVREEALGTSQWVAREQPDYLVLDVMMPALSGGELGQLLKRSTATNQTAVILHSSMAAASLQAVIQRTGAIGAIPKTSDGASFISDFERLISRAKPAKP